MSRRLQRRSPGLPRPLERYLTRTHGRGPAGRMMAAGTVRALGVLLRRHPAAVAEALGAGLLRAGRVGLGEFKDWLDDTPAARTPPARSTARLGPEERRRLLRFLKREARRDAATGTPPAEEAMHRHR